VKVGPFASEVAFSQLRDIDAEDMASFLTEELAVNHPELSVSFEHTAFFVSSVKGAIQSLNLDPAIEEAVQRRMEQLRQMVEEEVQERQRIRAAAVAAAALENGIENDTGVVGD
jgi:flavin-binding protein dodecin